LHCDEGWTVSLVKHGLVDGRKASMIILAHLVGVNRLFVGQTEQKKDVNRGPEGRSLPIGLF